MSSLPRVSGREVVKGLASAGYEQDRQRGSHIILRRIRIVALSFPITKK